MGEARFRAPREKTRGESKAVKSKKMEMRQMFPLTLIASVNSLNSLTRPSPVVKRVMGTVLSKLSFLEVTKGKRDVAVEDFFQNQSLFIDSAQCLMNQRGGGGLVGQ